MNSLRQQASLPLESQQDIASVTNFQKMDFKFLQRGTGHVLNTFYPKKH